MDSGAPRLGQDYPVLRIDTHEALAKAKGEISARLEAHPEIARLLLVNPILAFHDVNVELSPEIASHILHTIQYSPQTAARRRTLRSKLQMATDEAPRPSDGPWVAQFLFEKLSLSPLQTKNAAPAYKPVIDPGILAKQLASIPKLNVSPKLPHPDHGTLFDFGSVAPAARHLDLDAPVPKLPAAKERPDAVDLTTLFFYKDLNPLVHDLLELGIIESQAVQIGTPDTYRRVRSGEIPHPWGPWVSNVRFTPPQ